jgi:hypothetical protein
MDGKMKSGVRVEVIPHCFTLSGTGVTHTYPGGTMETITLEKLVREASLL